MLCRIENLNIQVPIIGPEIYQISDTDHIVPVVFFRSATFQDFHFGQIRRRGFFCVFFKHDILSSYKLLLISCSVRAG